MPLFEVNARIESVSDEDLARQSQHGSMIAFEELVNRYERRVYAFAVQFCGSRGDALEATQDTFVKAFQSLAQFDAGRNFGTWLFTIARRKCIDRQRGAPPACQELPELADPDTPAERLIREEQKAEIWRLASRHLSSAQFQVLWLRYVEELAVADIGRVLRISTTHVKVLLFRARKTLARHLRAHKIRIAPAPIPEPLALAMPSHQQLL